MTERNDDWIVFNTSEPAILSFPNLIEARAVTRNGKATGEAKFSTDAEFELNSADAKRIVSLCKKAALAKWPDLEEVKGRLKYTDDEGNEKFVNMPYKLGDRLADKAKAKSDKEGKERLREWSRGKFVLTARTKKEPSLAVVINGQAIDLDSEALKTAHAGKFYTGVEGLLEVTLAAYDAVDDTGTNGVTAYLNSVVSLNRGKKLISGRKSATEVFSGYLGKITDEDPSDGLGDYFGDDDD